jgi:hypothetical protein
MRTGREREAGSFRVLGVEREREAGSFGVLGVERELF